MGDGGNSGEPGRLRVRSVALILGAAAAVGVLAVLVGVSDNPPGIALLYASAMLAVTAFVHHWTAPRKFAWLALGSLAGFPLFAILHNLLYGVGRLTSEIPVLPMAFEFLHAAAFMVALILCPAGVVVGIVGFIVTVVRRRRPGGSTETGGRDPEGRGTSASR